MQEKNCLHKILGNFQIMSPHYNRGGGGAETMLCLNGVLILQPRRKLKDHLELCCKSIQQSLPTEKSCTSAPVQDLTTFSFQTNVSSLNLGRSAKTFWKMTV